MTVLQSDPWTPRRSYPNARIRRCIRSAPRPGCIPAARGLLRRRERPKHRRIEVGVDLNFEAPASAGRIARRRHAHASPLNAKSIHRCSTHAGVIGWSLIAARSSLGSFFSSVSRNWSETGSRGMTASGERSAAVVPAPVRSSSSAASRQQRHDAVNPLRTLAGDLPRQASGVLLERYCEARGWQVFKETLISTSTGGARTEC